MIVEDAKSAIATGPTPVILTRYKEQAKMLYDNLVDAAACMQLLLNIVYKSEKMLTEATDPDIKTNYSVSFSEEDIWSLLESDDLCNNETGLNYVDELPVTMETVERFRRISV